MRRFFKSLGAQNPAACTAAGDSGGGSANGGGALDGADDDSSFDGEDLPLQARPGPAGSGIANAIAAVARSSSSSSTSSGSSPLCSLSGGSGGASSSGGSVLPPSREALFAAPRRRGALFDGDAPPDAPGPTVGPFGGDRRRGDPAGAALERVFSDVALIHRGR